jgi:hypothetical protein
MDYNHRDAINDIKNLLRGKKLPPQEDFLVPTEPGVEKEQEDGDEEEKATEDKKGKIQKQATKKR